MELFKLILSLFKKEKKVVSRDRYCLKKLENYLSTGCRSVDEINKFLHTTSGRTYVARLRKKGVNVQSYWCNDRRNKYKRFYIDAIHE